MDWGLGLIHRYQETSFSVPFTAVLSCRQLMQFLNFFPVELDQKSVSLHTMSAGTVSESWGLSGSPVSSSRHKDEQGDPGVTCSALDEEMKRVPRRYVVLTSFAILLRTCTMAVSAVVKLVDGGTVSSRGGQRGQGKKQGRVRLE